MLKHKKYLISFVFLLSVFSFSCANAAWKVFSTIEEKDRVVIIEYDSSTVKKIGSITKVWAMISYMRFEKSESENEFKSEKILYAFKCSEQTSGVYSVVRYSALSGKGNVMGSVNTKEDEINWVPIVPESIGANLSKIVCNHRK